MKRIEWLGTSLNAIREFPADARALLGQELRLVQAGEMPSDFKPMPGVGAGAYEIRVRAGNQYRVIYVAKFSGSVYVLHAFVKKTPKTSQPDLDTAKSPLRRAAEGDTVMTEKIRVVVGSDNVFRDLGFPKAEAQNLLLRADLVIHIRKAIAKLDLTQAAAAKRAGISQPRMNDLVKGRTQKFTLDALVNVAAQLGYTVKLTMKKAA